MARQTRIQVTVSPEMTMALEVLSERTGLSTAAQAMVLLRQALDRTIGTAQVQARLAARRAQWTAADRRSDTGTNYMVEAVYAQFGPATREEVGHLGAQEAPAGR